MITNQANASIKYTLPDSSVSEKDFDSNIVNSYLMDEQISIVKSSNKTFLECGDIATQKITITNNSKVKITNLRFKDYLSGSGEYVSGSVIINQVSKPDYDLDSTFSLDDLVSGQSHVIEYKIKALENGTSDNITNYGNLIYNIEDSSQPEEDFQNNSNTVEINYVCSSLSVEKSVDKVFVQSGDVLTYTTVITNTGNVPTTELIFTDAIPEGTTFVADSLSMDNLPLTGKSPADGVKIANLGSGQKTTMRFQVTVD